ncbi:LytTr DNA-binding domain protein [Ruegeria sp. THAF57]|uniref:LytTR family DNA-binding domain-containing protein n=1 Tax=Ruegeria sp. THAF57 TaxID=2744555 RepID=UPI0015DDE09A|nr:LytTR family DNA-binding domain-containing protein [Ruegeria sp. THAF57]CAD0184859.1 LytTr DNA-binding domain protein [Ruegeria sp. THAF57]
MKTTLRSILAEFTLQRGVAGLVFLPLLAIAFQPFPGISLSFVPRLLFWCGAMALALALTWFVRRLFFEYLSFVEFRGRDVVQIALVFALFVPSVWSFAWLLLAAQGEQAPGILSVASYGGLFAAGLVLVRSKPLETGADHAPEPQKPRLLNRLPHSFQGQVFRLAVRDHSVDVVTSEGTFTIRSRFADAIAEMEPVNGHCTHRSHWVVDAAVSGVERQGGKIFLRLKNGELVPVSRKYKPELECDGIIQ